MQGNFTFQNPTRLHFGKESLSKLSDELKNYGPKVMLTYGGGSIKGAIKSVGTFVGLLNKCFFNKGYNKYGVWESAFRDCDNLKELYLPQGVKKNNGWGYEL